MYSKRKRIDSAAGLSSSERPSKRPREDESTATPEPATPPVDVQSDTTARGDQSGTQEDQEDQDKPNKRKHDETEPETLSDEPPTKKSRTPSSAVEPTTQANITNAASQDEYQSDTSPLLYQFPKKPSFDELPAEIRKKIYRLAYNPATDHIQDFAGLILSCKKINLDISRPNGEFVQIAACHYGGRFARRLSTHFTLPVRFARPTCIADLSRPTLLLPRSIMSLDRPTWPRAMNTHFKRATEQLQKMPVNKVKLGFRGKLQAVRHFNFDKRQQDRIGGIVYFRHVLAKGVKWEWSKLAKRFAGWKRDAYKVLGEIYEEAEIRWDTPDQYDMFNIWGVTTKRELADNHEIREVLEDLSKDGRNLMQYLE